jgi:hypothetical protein
VATVDATDHVRLKTIVIARDLGPSVEISSGLSANDRVVQSPPDGLGDGSLVRIAGNAARALAEDNPQGAHSGKDRNERS